MKLSPISDIASTSVAHIDIKNSAEDALNMMLKCNQRNIVIIDNDVFRLLTATDILKIEKEYPTLDIQLSDLNLSKMPLVSRDKNVLDTLEYLNNSIEYICVVNPDKTFYGLVTHTDITSHIDPDTLMDNYKLSNFFKTDRRTKWVKKEITTSALCEDMINEKFDNVLVVEDMKPVGILTTKDILQLIKNKNDLKRTVGEYMSTPVDTIHKDSSIKEALEFVNKKHYKRVIVVDDEGSLSGVITQKEFIALSYARWAVLMKDHHAELSEMNHILKNKNKEYEIMASTDPLTGLYNRFKFSELYLSEYKAMIQRDNDMSIILLDIDFFKRINDTYGHNIGDQVLIQVSHALLKTLRSIDIVCRWGGEEFVVLLPTASLDNAVYLAEKLRAHIEELEMDLVGKITASFGVSQVREDDEIHDVIARADKALYLAKNSGKNCVKMGI